MPLWREEISAAGALNPSAINTGKPMATYRYRGRDRTGRVVVGRVEASSPEAAGTQLYQQGYYPTAIEKEPESTPSALARLFQGLRGIGLEEILLFSQQLSTLYKAGLPLLTALSSLKEQTENTKFRKVIEDVGHLIEGGSTLFQAISTHPRVFPSIYCHMVRVGETTGRLGEALDRFVMLEQRAIRTRQKIKEAMRYPKLVLLSLVLASGVLIVFVIPRFAQIFSQFKTPLPLPTRVMIATNKIFQHYGPYVLLLMAVLFFLGRRFLQTPRGKFFWDRMKIRLPLLGPLFLKADLSRFAYSFVMLNQSGIPILQALEITSKTLDNTLLVRAVERIAEQIQEGWPLAEAMRESGRFTPMVIQMVSVGEASGTLDAMLMRVTEYYDIEVENGIRRLSTYIEPILTIVIAGAVLFLALAVFLPWWNLASLFR